MKNKFIITLFVLLIGVSLFSGIVSAQYYSGFGTENLIDSLTNVLEPALIALFGGDSYTGYLLFEKLLLFILVGVFVYLALGNISLFDDKNKKLAKLIAVIVSLIGIRNIDYLWFNTIFTQYAVLFVAIAGILPFVIYWFFLKEMPALPRKVGWIFFAVVYFGLWITTEVDAHEEVYLITALASLFYAFFVDSSVHNWLEVQNMKKGNKYALSNAIANLSDEIQDIEDKLVAGHYRGSKSEKLAEEKVRRLEKRIRKLQKGL
jgi:hypothetical protein|tara:strand:- start:185 stop:970 length:786 start_codon:yes stop_codon:yes gene_type:complete